MADNDKITELANRIYALDEKVYKATGSNLGRVYQGNKEKCINDLRDLIKSSADSSVLRSELALILSPYREQDWLANYPLYSVSAIFG